METRSVRKVKLAEEGRPKRMLKVTEKAKPIIQAKLAEQTGKTKKVGRPQRILKVAEEIKTRTGRKHKGSKVAEEPKKTKKRKALEVASGNEANGPDNSSFTADNEPTSQSQPVPFTSNKKKTRAINVLVRRSGRLNNAVSSENIQEKKDTLEINLTDSDGEVELHVEPVVLKPARVVGSPKLKRGRKPFASETTETVDYKTLYIDSQKKIEASTEENLKRAIELSYLRGKVDAYEYMIGNMKNVVAFSNMKRVTDAEMNLSDGTAPDARAHALNTDNKPGPSPVTIRRLKKNKS